LREKIGPDNAFVQRVVVRPASKMPVIVDASASNVTTAG
jgi:hypothetical protein